MSNISGKCQTHVIFYCDPYYKKVGNVKWETITAKYLTLEKLGPSNGGRGGEVGYE